MLGEAEFHAGVNKVNTTMPLMKIGLVKFGVHKGGHKNGARGKSRAHSVDQCLQRMKAKLSQP